MAAGQASAQLLLRSCARAPALLQRCATACTNRAWGCAALPVHRQRTGRPALRAAQLAGSTRAGGLARPQTSLAAVRAAAAGGTSTQGAGSGGLSEVAEPGDYVQVHYVGTLEDGQVFDSSRERGSPLDFILGSGKVVSGFEKAVMGLPEHGKGAHRAAPADGYGEWRSEMTAKVPADSAPANLAPGTRIELNNGLQARVMSVNDEFVEIDANHELAGKTLNFEVELMRLTKAAQLQKATFGAGCFWGPELAFQRVPGVAATAVGYAQGHVDNPTYKDVCSGTSGHVEVVQVTYDPREAAYERLLDAFFACHDPTQKDRQGGDVGTQYRSGIYTHSPEQRAAAQAALERKAAELGTPLATELADISNYYQAEDYHQQYLARGGRFGRAQNPAKGCSDPIRCYG